MNILRTSEADATEILNSIADYPSGSRFVSIPAGDGADDGRDLRVHMVDSDSVDTGDANTPVVVFLHGNPSWSYIWRHQIAAAMAAGYRVIAPDLVGMGLSDKPSEMNDYTVARHVEWMRSLLVDELSLLDATFVLHDWGGIIGMRLAAENPGLVNRLVISNTGLPWRDLAEPLPDVIEATGPFADFQEFARTTPQWQPWTLLPITMVTEPSDDVVHGYQAPYPDPSLTMGSRAFTQLLPTRPDNPMYPACNAAWEVFDAWTQPVLTIFSDQDAVAPDGWKPIVARIPGAQGQPHVILEGGGHFLQEDLGPAYTDALMAWLGPAS